MKKILALLLAVSAFGVAAAGCGARTENTNKEFNEKEMTTVAGTPLKITDDMNLIGGRYSGFIFATPKSFDSKTLANNLEVDNSESEAYANYVPEAYNAEIERLRAVTDNDEWEKGYDELMKKACKIGELVRIDKKDEGKVTAEAKKSFSDVEKLAEIGSDAYLIAYNTSFGNRKDLSKTDDANLKTLTDGFKEIRNNIMLFPVQKEDQACGNSTKQEADLQFDFKGDLTKIETTDMDGNKVTGEIFGEHDLTMVNIWETGCGSCIGEMGELGKLSKMLPKNVALVTICLDSNSDNELVKKIIKSSGAELKTLQESDSIKAEVGNNVDAVPTTLFVDKSGKVVYGMIGVPANKEGAAAGYMEHIKSLTDGKK